MRTRLKAERFKRLKVCISTRKLGCQLHVRADVLMVSVHISVDPVPALNVSRRPPRKQFRLTIWVLETLTRLSGGVAHGASFGNRSFPLSDLLVVMPIESSISKRTLIPSRCVSCDCGRYSYVGVHSTGCVLCIREALHLSGR